MKKILLATLLTLLCSAVYSQTSITQSLKFKELKARVDAEMANQTSVPAIPANVGTNPVTDTETPAYPVLQPTTTTNGSKRGTGITQTIIFNAQGNTRLVTIIRL